MASCLKSIFGFCLLAVAASAAAEQISPFPEWALERCGVFVFGEDATLAHVSQAVDPKGIFAFHRENGEKISLGLTSHKIEAKDATSLQNGDKVTMVYGKATNEESRGFKAAMRGSLREVCNESEKACGGIFAILDGDLAVEGPKGVVRYSVEALNGCISLK